MKLVTLFALLPIAYSERIALYNAQDGYGIVGYTFSWMNVAETLNVDWDASTDAVTDMITKINDGTDSSTILGTGTESLTWSASGLTNGVFSVSELNPGVNKAYYSITKASLTLSTDGCYSESYPPQVTAFRYAPGSDTKIIMTVATEVVTGSPVTLTFSVESAEGFAVNNGRGIGFEIEQFTRGALCEGAISIVDFTLEGTALETAQPTTASPTPSPTTKAPTPSPTRSCKGEITWGDPHYALLAFDNSAPQFNYQGIGWYYYFFPCDIENDYEDWPFFILSDHKRCWWHGNPKGCINNNKLVLNTKPDPWEIDFSNHAVTFVKVGTDVQYSQTNKPLNNGGGYSFTYDDGNSYDPQTQTGSPKQSGEIHITLHNSDGQVQIEMFNVAFGAYPRTCFANDEDGVRLIKTGKDCGDDYMCEGKVIEIRNADSWTVFSCPTCFRNIACGLTGKYIRGDCTWSQANDVNNLCAHVLVGSDGVTYGPPNGQPLNDDTFFQFANTWHQDQVSSELSTLGMSARFARKRSDLSAPKTLRVKEGRAFNDLAVADAGFYDGLCKDNMAKIQEVNETCRQNTVVQYSKCCEEIGICPMLWKACVEDLCSCTAPAPNNTWGDTECLEAIIHESMNYTCSWDNLWPTAAPTGTPTKTPTTFIVGLTPGKKAMELIWVYLVFVLVFVGIAGAAFWYYRKKNKNGSASFPQDEEQAERRDIEMDNNDTTTYA